MDAFYRRRRAAHLYDATPRPSSSPSSSFPTAAATPQHPYATAHASSLYRFPANKKKGEDEEEDDVHRASHHHHHHRHHQRSHSAHYQRTQSEVDTEEEAAADGSGEWYGAERVSRYDEADATSAVATALQQQYETTRLLSRLLAGVTLQWREVVERLDEACIPPRTSAKVNDDSDMERAAAVSTPRRRTASREGSRHRRRSGETPRLPQHTHSHAPVTTPSAAAAAKASRRESDATAAGSVSDNWASLAPSAQWVPYVVGQHSGGSEKRDTHRHNHDHEDNGDAWRSRRYEGVLYASPHLGNRHGRVPTPRRRRLGGSVTRCVECDADAAEEAVYNTAVTKRDNGSCHDDDAGEREGGEDCDDARLRRAVLHGMALSAEKMVMGMRQVQRLLPATLQSSHTRAAATPTMEVNKEGPPLRQDGATPTRHGNRSHGSALTSSSPQPRRCDSHKSTRPSPRQLSAFSISRHGKESGDDDHQGSPMVVYPALPVEQRTWIYPHIDHGSVANSNSSKNNSIHRHRAWHRSPVRSPSSSGSSSSASVTPKGRARGASTCKNTSTPALRGVTPIMEGSVGASLVTERRPERRRRGSATPAASPLVRRQLDWRPTPAGPSQQSPVSGHSMDRANQRDHISRIAARAVARIAGEKQRGANVFQQSAPLQEQQPHASFATLRRAEEEHRLRLAVYHEASLRSMLQAHYHQLWVLRGREAEHARPARASREEWEKTTTTANGSRRTRRSGQRVTSSPVPALGLASRRAPSVSLSPFSASSTSKSVSWTTESNPTEFHPHTANHGAATIEDTSTAAAPVARSPIADLQSPAFATALSDERCSSVESFVLVQSMENGEGQPVPVTQSSPVAHALSLPSSSSPLPLSASPTQLLLPAPSLSPSSPSVPLSPVHGEFMGTEDSSKASRRRLPASLTPPLPTPPPPAAVNLALTPAALRQPLSPAAPAAPSFSTTTTNTAAVSWTSPTAKKTLISPPVDRDAAHRHRRASWDIAMPPAERRQWSPSVAPTALSSSAELTAAVHERDTAHGRTLTDHLAAVSSSNSPVSARGHKRHSAEWAAEEDAWAHEKEEETENRGEAAEAKPSSPCTDRAEEQLPERGVRVALELFPSTSAARPPTRAADRVSFLQKEEEKNEGLPVPQHRSLISPSPPPNRDDSRADMSPLPPALPTLHEDGDTKRREAVVQRPGSERGAGGLSRGSRRRSLLESPIVEKPTALTSLAAQPADTSQQPLTGGIPDAEGGQPHPRNSSSSSSSSSSREKSGSSILYRIESASLPPASEAVPEDEKSRYSSVSSVVSHTPEMLAGTITASSGGAATAAGGAGGAVEGTEMAYSEIPSLETADGRFMEVAAAAADCAESLAGDSIEELPSPPPKPPTD